MDAGRPDEAPPLPQPASLADRVVDALRARKAPAAGRPDWRVGTAVAVLLASGPLLTLVGASLLAEKARDSAAELRQRLAPGIAADAGSQRARDALAPIVARPTATATLETLSRVLPADASLIGAERTANGGLAFDIATADPDRLRTALRRSPALVGLRNTGQRQGDGVLIVSLGEVR